MSRFFFTHHSIATLTSFFNFDGDGADYETIDPALIEYWRTRPALRPEFNEVCSGPQSMLNVSADADFPRPIVVFTSAITLGSQSSMTISATPPLSATQSAENITSNSIPTVHTTTNGTSTRRQSDDTAVSPSSTSSKSPPQSSSNSSITQQTTSSVSQSDTER